MKWTLGIHTETAKNKKIDHRTHSWITVSNGSKVFSYGLYPSEDPSTFKDGSNVCDIRADIDLSRRPTSSRFMELPIEKLDDLSNSFNDEEKYDAKSNNCTHWACKTLNLLTNENFNGVHLFNTETLEASESDGENVISVTSPVGLEKEINHHNKEFPTKQDESIFSMIDKIKLPSKKTDNDNDHEL